MFCWRCDCEWSRSKRRRILIFRLGGRGYDVTMVMIEAGTNRIGGFLSVAIKRGSGVMNAD